MSQNLRGRGRPAGSKEEKEKVRKASARRRYLESKSKLKKTSAPSDTRIDSEAGPSIPASNVSSHSYYISIYIQLACSNKTHGIARINRG